MNDEWNNEDVKEIVHAINRLSNAITPLVAGNNDATGCHVESLTEAVMGTTSALCKIADAIESLAAAVENHG